MNFLSYRVVAAKPRRSGTKPHRRSTVSGFTVLELMVTLALAAILLTLAIPNLRVLIQNNRMTATANELVTGMQLSRSEALKLRQPVSICARDGAGCGDDWAQGWRVFVDTAGIGASSPTVGRELRVWPALTDGLTLNDVEGVDFIRFLPDGRVDGTSGFPWVFELRIPDCTRDTARDVVVGRLGSVSTERIDC